MIGKILNTFSAKLIIVLLSFGTVLLTTNFLGASGHGQVSLIMLGLSIILMVNNVIGGNALVYLAPRRSPLRLMIPAYGWAVIASAIVTWLLDSTSMIPEGIAMHLFLNAALHSFTFVNISILLGKQKVLQHNIVQVLHFLSIVIVLAILFLYLDRVEILSYIHALYAAHILSFLLSLGYLLPFLHKTTPGGLQNEIRLMLKYGFLVQLANLAQMLNYRLSYYLLAYFSDTAMVGIYAVGVSISETLWIISRSTAMVLYSRISNTSNAKRSAALTLMLAKLAITGTFLFMIILLLLPEQLFTSIFGSEFGEVKLVLYGLAPGIVVFSYSILITHYFSGIGKYYVNTIISLSGLVVTLIAGLILIPALGLAGAALTASLSYILMAIAFSVWFCRDSQLSWKNLLPLKYDWMLLYRIVRKIIR